MIIEALKNEGVRVVFGYPGGAALNIYDEIYKQNYFTHILSRHEQAAIHAADGFARASGEVGVAIVTSGPGFTNAITGIATAYCDSVPMVVISGQVPLSLIGTDAFQEIDAVGISRPCTKHNYLVKSIEELPRILKEAFYIARSGRPGPVHIDIPKDITATLGDFNYPSEISLRTYKPTYKGNSRQIKKAAEAIKEAKKPILYLGGGCVASDGAVALVREFTELLEIPAVETLMARGVLSADNENLLGMVGMHGSYAANMAMSETDLIIALGARFDDRVTSKLSEFAKFAKIIHIDVDPSSISKIVSADFPIVGDLSAVLEELLALLQANADEISNNLNSWRQTCKNFAKLHPLGDLSISEKSGIVKDSQGDSGLSPQWILQSIGKIIGENAVICTDVGQHQMWAAQFFPFSRTRQLITSGGLGTMGFGLPAAMGAVFAENEKVIINISGDGSILMNIQELATCVEYELRVINIVLNNRFLGMVRQWQSLFYEKRFSQTDLARSPDFKKIAESFGALGFNAENESEFENALKAAMKVNLPSIINVKIPRFADVLPMVPTGGALFNMILK